MKLLVLLLTLSLCVPSSAQTSYKMQVKDPVTKKIKTTDITEEYLALQDSLVKIKEMKQQPIIHMPIVSYDGGVYKWRGVFKPLTLDTMHMYVVIINPDIKPLEYNYNLEAASSNFNVKRVKVNLIRQTDDPTNPWNMDKKSFDIKLQEHVFKLIVPQKSFVVFSLEKKK